MQLALWKKLIVAAAVLAVFGSFAAFSPTSIGQEAAKKKAAVKEVKEQAKAKGRLPAYYGKIVSDEQREKIYAIQAKFDSQIESLTAQLETLRKQRDSEVEAVLTAEQKTQVAEARSAADAKKKKKSDAPAAKKAVESEKKTEK